jgi:hypothetical protein
MLSERCIAPSGGDIFPDSTDPPNEPALAAILRQQERIQRL